MMAERGVSPRSACTRDELLPRNWRYNCLCALAYRAGGEFGAAWTYVEFPVRRTRNRASNWALHLPLDTAPEAAEFSATTATKCVK